MYKEILMGYAIIPLNFQQRQYENVENLKKKLKLLKKENLFNNLILMRFLIVDRDRGYVMWFTW